MALYKCPVASVFGQAVIDFYADAAGPDHMWDGLKGGHEQGSKVKRLIRGDLAERQGYVCAVCAESFTDEDMETLRVEANHVVAQGSVKRGWFPGDVFVGHKDCNAKTAPLYDGEGNLIGGKPNLDMSDLKAPEVIPMEWTPLPILKRAAWGNTTGPRS
jgi:hypothetical protein